MKKGLLFTLPLLLSASLFAQDAAPQRQQSMYQTLIMIGIALLFFYLILWRPEQKRRKKMQEQRANLAKGDRVTAMGIVGTVDQIKEQTVVLKMVDGSKIEVVTGAITEVQSAAQAASASEETTKS